MRSTRESSLQPTGQAFCGIGQLANFSQHKPLAYCTEAGIYSWPIHDSTTYSGLWKGDYYFYTLPCNDLQTETRSMLRRLGPGVGINWKLCHPIPLVTTTPGRTLVTGSARLGTYGEDWRNRLFGRSVNRARRKGPLLDCHYPQFRGTHWSLCLVLRDLERIILKANAGWKIYCRLSYYPELSLL